ncbi:unnamed protein product, partial [Auanema sp. JU1783]
VMIEEKCDIDWCPEQGDHGVCSYQPSERKCLVLFA